MKWTWGCILILVIAYFIGANWPSPAQWVQSKIGIGG